jgi:hypothetical protein
VSPRWFHAGSLRQLRNSSKRLMSLWGRFSEKVWVLDRGGSKARPYAASLEPAGRGGRGLPTVQSNDAGR